VSQAASNQHPHPAVPARFAVPLERAAAENRLPVEFLARVIWQESRFNATAVSAKGAEGIAQFMPQTAGWRDLADPFNPIEALRHSASYLHDLMAQFGNVGLAAGYNTGPGRVKAWLAGRARDAQLPRDCHWLERGRTGVTFAIANGRRDDPAGCTLCSACQYRFGSEEEAKRIASYVPRWGSQLAAHLLESKAWAIYREKLGWARQNATSSRSQMMIAPRSISYARM